MATHQEIPWRDIAGTRDKFIHGYFEIELDLVWDIVQRDIPDIHRKIEQLLEMDEKNPRIHL